VAQPAVNNPEKTGLAYWMDRALEQHSKLNGNWSPKLSMTCASPAPMHPDCRPNEESGPCRRLEAHAKGRRRLFRQLGTLRDTQVLAEWVQKLGSPDEVSTAALIEKLKAKYGQDRVAAQSAAREFDKKQWRLWSRELASRFRHVAADKSACEALTLEIWETVRDSHRHAQKNRSGVAYHRVRVELKKISIRRREFSPFDVFEWAPELKFLQDLLGEIHDLDVLSQLIKKEKNLFDEAARGSWTTKLQSERNSRLEQYRAKMAGKASPLWTWRAGFPGGGGLRSAGLARLAEWAYFVTPSFPRARRIARFALQLHDGFANCGLIGSDSNIEERFILHAAALLQEVGRFKEKRLTIKNLTG